MRCSGREKRRRSGRRRNNHRKTRRGRRRRVVRPRCRRRRRQRRRTSCLRRRRPGRRRRYPRRVCTQRAVRSRTIRVAVGPPSTTLSDAAAPRHPRCRQRICHQRTSPRRSRRCRWRRAWCRGPQLRARPSRVRQFHAHPRPCLASSRLRRWDGPRRRTRRRGGAKRTRERAPRACGVQLLQREGCFEARGVLSAPVDSNTV
mmetsp:Transcript_91216/g.260528  ORF Transcript_91216/g.260528 Transcript_91216/m.260528 type:complete len:202 (-) Transcript_91216:111-716(-)